MGSHKRSMTLLISLLALTLIGGLAFYRPFDAKRSEPIVVTVDGKPVPAPPPLPEKRQTFLVLGVDDRPDRGGRADSMIVVSHDPAKNHLAMLSLPRDTWVYIPGYRCDDQEWCFDKINHSFAYGGEALAEATVEQLLGIPIDHTVSLSFQGFTRIIDELGGIEVDAEKRLYYHDPDDTGMGPDGLLIDIEPGLQKMDGLTALGYARFRMDEEGDLGRVRRQQQVMKAVMRSAASPSVLGRIPQLTPAVASAVNTDLSVAEMIKLALGGKEALSKPLRTGTLGGQDQILGGIFYLVPDLVTVRTAAYETLVGAQPSEAFLKRAREDQAVYARELSSALQAQGPGGVSAEPASTQSDQPAGTPPADTAQTGATAGPGAQSAVAPPKPATIKPKPLPITVAVIDASGRNLGPTYATLLKAAGFRVARVAKSGRTVTQTTAIDHAGQAGTKERLREVLSKVYVIARPDKNAAEAVEIVLGQDLP